MLKLALALVLAVAACGGDPGSDPVPGDSGMQEAPPRLATKGIYLETWAQTSAGQCYQPQGWSGCFTGGDWCTAIRPFTTTETPGGRVCTPGADLAPITTTDDSCTPTCVPGDHAATVTLTCGRCTATYAVTFTAQ